ncbi:MULTISPECIES: 16S rRNA (cytidine(1402)-2'-O)-methyltransferase [Priestia]|jgi:16S rRNA (cytidine1402-2'-O)-methyltransferase|uniref:16S rRNA (cytidine(1402)-2'-O)-methyltransferase n=1 Tax=Priestia TaxID=2800373 RepID=UPI0007C50522|nr:16S rRNA (cytidine(1402)-2'-O)-methyltransferase [Priestia megaterium]MDH6651692.1 16S rRNA (cytidine1402-2'-O)-methyltransferase [Bacillus sp. PvP124]MDP9579985.1 16S rRNA (cytidine1402-2'-O)-methyltransferase [Bacillus sp. 1751]MBG9470839.1 16S rRNA methyltransferase [Priestia megaterium]MDF2053453.1 16S rRNA (cytidine(1402)-2'-O)-methyltransferase [Priestia megaterium]MDF2062855.1 16S rRNA (cytidine(1402)-2'-O)-methyltransferase [Priestia megaterium]
MKSQKSYDVSNERGVLYLVPTPIGNLEDMTFRAIRILKEVDYIAAEDTRQTKKLCNHFEIDTPITSYHEHNKHAKSEQLLSDLDGEKNIALVSDAGMPCISDPGYELVVAAVKKGYTVVPLPGPNAALTALIASGLPTGQFYFYGFLNRNKKQRKEQLQELQYIKESMIFYEAPHRLKETLKSIEEILGNRSIVLCRELTKRYEEFLRGSVLEAIEWTNATDIRGEFCLILEGTNEEAPDESNLWWEQLTIIEHVDHYVEEGLSNKEAIKQVAKDRDVSKRDIYSEYHVH